jgi:uncharacterized protein (TIGR04222 family)
MTRLDVAVLAAYALVAVAAAILLVRDMRRTSHAAQARPPAVLEPEEVAALWGGDDDHMIATALTSLRFSRLLEADADGRLSVTGAPRASTSDLARTAHAAIEGSPTVTVAALLTHPDIAAGVARIKDDLARRGLLLAPWQRRRIVRARIALAGLAVIPAGFVVVRSDVFAIPGLIGLAVGIAVFVLLLVRPRRTAAGEKLLRETAATQHRLDPVAAPEWTELAPSSVAMAVALYGTIVLAVADPPFAGAAGIESRRTDATKVGGSDVGEDGATPGYWGTHLG